MPPQRHFPNATKTVRGGYGKGGIAKTSRRRLPSNMARIGTKLCQNAFQTIPDISIFGEKKNFLTKVFGLENRFSPFWADFGGSTSKWTSKSGPSHFFALDEPILRSVRPKTSKICPSAPQSLGAADAIPPRTYPPLMVLGKSVFL